MLDKIIRNINTDVRLSSDDKSKQYERYGRKKDSENDQDKDSLVFSPAAAYLASLEWELHTLEYPSNDKVKLEFVINKMFFRIIIDFTNYYINLSQPIYILKEINNKKISVILNLAKRKLWFIDHYEEINFLGLESLFDKLSLYNPEDKLDNSLDLQEINEELEISLNSELQYILAAIFTFLDKLAKFKIIKKFQFNNDSKELVKIQKVSIQNAK